MLNDTIVTLQGHVGGEVALRQAAGVAVANFRVACTPRRYQRASETWVDGQTQWYSVSAWRALGEHCGSSLRTGDAVLVHGKLTARTYINAVGVEVLTHEIEALVVGHDLTRGTSAFTKAGRPAASGEQGDGVSQDADGSRDAA